MALCTVLTLIDDYSKYTYIYSLQNKSKMPKKIMNLIAIIKDKCNKYSKCFRSKKGKEYINIQMEKLQGNIVN